MAKRSGSKSPKAKATKASLAASRKVEELKPPTPDDSEDDDNDVNMNDEDERMEVPPKPISSDDEDDDEDEDDVGGSKFKSSSEAALAYRNASSSNNDTVSSTAPSSSRLFAPYRSLGQVSSGRPFYLLPHQNSAESMLCVPVDNHFQLVSTDKLGPSMVGQGLAGQSVQHVVADATLSVTVVGHCPKQTSKASSNLATGVTLYHRTAPIQTIYPASAASSDSSGAGNKRNAAWKMVDMLHLGRVQMPGTGEKKGKTENAAIIAVILAKQAPEILDDENDEEKDVMIVGDDDDDDSENENDSENEDEEDGDDPENEDCMGQVVIMVATRTSLHIQKRIRFSSDVNLATFCPVTALHPSTYLNKIVVAGSDQGKSAMILLNIRSGKVIHEFQCLPTTGKESTVTTMEQSPAVDTIAVGTDQGNVHLVNLRHDKKLFSLRHQSRDSKVVTIQSISFRTDGSAMHYGIAPMAVGRSDGTVTIWDLTPPETADAGRQILHEMDRVHPGGIAKLQYMPQEPLLVSTGTASNSIMMHIFDNPDHSARVLRQRKGHTSAPSRIRYLHPGAGAGGGVMANASDGTDASACQILSSGGLDRTLRIFSTARSVLDKEYSQGQGLDKKAKKFNLESTAELLLPPLTSMATSESRSRDWGDLVTIHQNHSFAYVWSTRRGAQSGALLKQPSWAISAMKVPPPTRTHATSVAMSACGNFAIVGTRGGIIYKYNVQSGVARGSYPRNATDEKEEAKTKNVAGDVSRTMRALDKQLKSTIRESNLDKKEVDAVHEAKLEQQRRAKLLSASHTGFAVTGVAVDSVNKTLISVGADAKLVLWNFTSHSPHKKSPYTLPCAATKMCHVRDSDLAAIALEDFTVVLFDCAALSIVRRFGSGGVKVRHTGPISDLAFSPDGRSLFSSSLDGTVRVWDVPTNSCVDWLSFGSPPTSLTISPTGEFMATTHTGQLGISVWSDRSFYQTVHVDGTPLAEPARMDDPAPISESLDVTESHGKLNRGRSERRADTTEEELDDEKVPAVPKEVGLITLSGLPPGHWKNLFHLELVKERNKPKEPPKKPPSAPFFLQWRSGEALGDNAEAGAKPDEEAKQDDEWAAAWSDDDEDAKQDTGADAEPKRDRESAETAPAAEIKRRKVTHYRSNLASLLETCSQKPVFATKIQTRFQDVTDHIAGMGPSAIDVALSSLCNGMHDLEVGLPLLQLACQWLLEACESRERYEAVNAYLHRFLYLHASVITGVDDSFQFDKEAVPTEEERLEKETQKEQRAELLDSISQLRQAQEKASEALRGKMQHTLCLLRHFSRMV
jgi:U3 small nucleolar RNA-associated protein 21